MKINKKSALLILILFVVVFFTSNSVSAVDTNKVWITQTPSGGAANSQSTNPSVSADGRYVAFESYASNIDSGSSGRGIQDIYVYDYETNTTEWITHTPTGGAANGNSYLPSISGDGRYVTFASQATNLGPGGSGNGIKDIFVYDRTLDVMKWITHSPNGGPASNDSNNPVISADGTTIAFQSTAKNLGTGGSEYYVSDIYLYDLTSSAPGNYPQWITHTVRGYTANGASMDPTISADGRYVAFETVATNLGKHDYERFGTGNGVKDIFRYDSDTGIMDWITKNFLRPIVKATPDGSNIPGGYYGVPKDIKLDWENGSGKIYYSLDGSIYKLYTSEIPLTTNTVLSFFGITIDNQRTHTTTIPYFIDKYNTAVWAIPATGYYDNYVEVALYTNTDGGAIYDNSIIYYSTDGSDPEFSTQYVHNGDLIRINTLTTLRFKSENGAEGAETYTIVPSTKYNAINPSISADGKKIAFEGNPEVFNSVSNIYLYNENSSPITNQIYLITKTSTNSAANGNSHNPTISGDGKYVAFESTANNLGIDPNQPYGSNMPGVVFYDDSFRRDIFQYELEKSSIFYLDWITHDTIYGPANGNSYTPSLNEDGSILAISSSAYNLGPGGSKVYRDIFLFDDDIAVTADKASGAYKGPLTVNLSLVNGSGSIYYTTDGSDPASGILYTGPLTITSDTYLRFVGLSGGVWGHNFSRTYTIKKPPTVTANPAGGIYTNTINITLTTVDPDSTATTYYTTDGSDPMSSAARKTYVNPILIATTTVLRFAAVDPDGMWSPNYTENYTINLPPDMITIAQINAAATKVKTYYDSHSKKLPSSVTINGSSYNMSQFLYLLVTATRNMNSGNLAPIKAKAVNAPTSPSGTIVSGNIVKTNYLTYAKSIQSYINTNGRAPNYVKTSLGKMQLKYMVYMYSKIVNYYLVNNRLPNYVSLTK